MTTLMTIHLVSVFLFTSLIFVKTVQLLQGKIQQLEKLKRQTRIAEGIDIAIALITGIILAYSNWAEINHLVVWVKLGLILVTIPIGIKAFRFHKKMMGPVTMALLGLVWVLTIMPL